MKIAVIGGGSTYTPELVSGLSRERDKIDVSAFHFADFDGYSANKDAGDLSIKTYGNINAAEHALGFDIDGVDGPSSLSGPVTVVFGNVDGGSPDVSDT